jgi:HD-GYP domain-containing protein (c-di-GMP phosphodiesterase class II)
LGRRTVAGPVLDGVGALLDGRPGLVSLCRRIARWDRGLWRHSQEAAVLAGRVAAAMWLDAPAIELVQLGALAHDAGKLVWPDFMRTAGELGPAGLALIRAHPIAGAGIVRGVWPEAPAAVVAAVRQHHERWAGTGYPDGLRGEEVSPAGRIVAAVEAFCAMREARAYRPHPIPPAEAVALLRRDGHDPAVVDVLERLVLRGAIVIETAASRG